MVTRRVISSIVLASLLIVTGAPSVSATGGSCPFNYANKHIVVVRHTDDIVGTYFEHVSGRTVVRDLTPCQLFTPNGEGTCVLPANLETAAGFATQLGYCQRAGDATERFYWVAANPPAANVWPLSWTPQVGTEYRFDITRGSTIGQPGKFVFRITKTATGAFQELAVTHSWSDDLDGAWWGGEALDTESVHGTFLSQLDVTTTFMQYQTETGVLTQRSNMSGTDCCDVVITSGTPSDRHGKIKDGNYPGSVLKVWTDG